MKDTDLITLIEDLFKFKPTYLCAIKDDEEIFSFGQISSDKNTINLSSDSLTVSIQQDKTKRLTSKAKTHLLTILSMYLRYAEPHIRGEVLSGTKLLDIIAEHRSIDIIIKEILNSLINLGFKSAAVMFLNEALMELRGVIFKSTDLRDDESTAFRMLKVDLQEQTPVTDVMFFQRTQLISFKDFEATNSLSEYFPHDSIITGLGRKNQPAGILVLSKNDIDSSDTDIAALYGSLFTLSLEFTKSLKKLELTEQDLKSKNEQSESISSLSKLGGLTATVAHELKNPLVAIAGFAERLMESGAINGDKQVGSYSQMIHSEALRLENLVRDILTYARKFNIKPNKENLSKEVESVIRVLMQNISHFDKNIRTSIDNTIEIYVDKDRFRQVLINLIDNALHATDEFMDVHISASENNSSVVLNIEDSGSGLSVKDMENIFEPFYTTKKEGTGLGLSISKKIMIAHGGDITARNGNTGAVFSIIIPKMRSN